MDFSEALKKIRGIDCGRVEKNIEAGLRDFVKKAGRGKVVVGLSGGIDSSTVAFISVKALNKENVLAAILPTSSTRKEDLAHARMVAESLGLEAVEFDIEGIVRAIARLNSENLKPMTRIDLGNIAARVRMACLYNLAARSGGLVAGTSDRSEILLGYFTKYGDGGADVLPVGGLFKTQVRELARWLEVPREIIEKPSSPAFWLGQTAEEELGASYEELDVILWALFEKKWSVKKIEGLGFKKWMIGRVERMHFESEHKRKTPAILKAFK